MWLLLPILFYSLLYLYVRHVYSHWTRRGYPAERTGLRWRFLKQVYQREFDHVAAVSEAYAAAGRLPFLGIYFFFRPTLLVRDVQLARSIAEHTHSHFQDARWEHVRSYRKINLLEKLAPMFAARRVEGMFRNVEKVGEHLRRHLAAAITPAERITVDMQNVLKIYAINVMANLVYGLDINLFEAEADSIFAAYAGRPLRSCLAFSYTLDHLPQKSTLAYRLRDLIKEGVARREDDGYIRKDVLQLLVKYRNGNELGGGSAAAKENWHIDNVFVREKALCIPKLAKVAENLLGTATQAVTSAAVLTLLEVLQEPRILQKILEEIGLLDEEGREGFSPPLLSHEQVAAMKYLDVCIQETFRKYPSEPIIERVCSRRFNIPHSRFAIGAGKTVMVPLLALQRDERHFQEPLRYWPERFVEPEAAEQTAKFLSHGLAASTGIAQRFTKLVVKLALLKLLQHFHVELAEQPAGAPPPLTHAPAPLIRSRDGLPVRLKRRAIKATFY